MLWRAPLPHAHAKRPQNRRDCAGRRVTPIGRLEPIAEVAARLKSLLAATNPAMLFAKIIVVQGKTRLAPEINQGGAKRNQRTHKQ